VQITEQSLLKKICSNDIIARSRQAQVSQLISGATRQQRHMPLLATESIQARRSSPAISLLTLLQLFWYSIEPNLLSGLYTSKVTDSAQISSLPAGSARVQWGSSWLISPATRVQESTRHRTNVDSVALSRGLWALVCALVSQGSLSAKIYSAWSGWYYPAGPVYPN
jgi:hypothetical protein